MFEDFLKSLGPEPIMMQLRQATFMEMAFDLSKFGESDFKMPGPAGPSEEEKILAENRELLREYGVTPGGDFLHWDMTDEAKAILERKGVEDFLLHEMLNIYGQVGIAAPYLEPTWFAFREDTMDDVLPKAGDSLEKTLFNRLNIRPVIISDEGDQERLFLARFEFPKYGANLKYSEADLGIAQNKCLGWIDFLSGFHYGCCEMLMVAGEVSTKVEDFPSMGGENGPVPPVPKEIFDERFLETRTLHNYIWLEAENAEGLVDGLTGLPQPAGPHWFFRVNCIESQKWPYPGEFLGLANRIFPNLPWSIAENPPAFHPFLFSGMFMDTVYITSAEVIAVETAPEGFTKVQVLWREKRIWVYPTDFAEYELGDRVTICKDVKTSKTSEFWDDEDLWTFDEEIWRIAPLTYYGKGFGGF